MILALDISGHTGWAFGDGVDAPSYGTFHLPSTGDDLGRYGAAFLRWLESMLINHKPREVVFEAPFIGKIARRPRDLRKLFGLGFVAETVAACCGVPISEVPVGTWRAAFLGRHYPRQATRDELKRAVIDGCRLRGWNPLDDNAADALGILDYALGLRRQGYAAHSFLATMGAAS